MHRTPSLALCITLVWTLFAVVPAHAQPGTVLSHQKISDTQGGFEGVLDDADLFGISVASLGDLDGDGIGDIVVGAQQDDDGGNDRGAVWVLFLEQGGTVKSHQKISSTEGGFGGILHDEDRFGCSVTSLGDLDGDGIGDLAVGALGDDDGGGQRGAVWVLFLNADGTVKAHQKISDIEGGFIGTLDDGDNFGTSLASLGDLDGDGVGDLAVGTPFDDDGGTPPNADLGAVWVLFLNSDGTVKSYQKISDTEGGFGGSLDTDDEFGWEVASLGDLDGDGIGDIVVGARLDDDGDSNRGAVWVLFLNSDGSVKSHQKISDTQGGFDGTLDDGDNFGYSVASLGDLDGDGIGDLAVGAYLDDDGGDGRGAVWVLFLEQDGTVKSHQKISDTEGGFGGTLDNRDFFGSSSASLGDLDGDGVGDIAVGAYFDDDGGSTRGAVWVLLLDGVPADCDGDGIPDIEETDTDGDGIVDDCDSCPLDNPDDTDGDGVCESDDICAGGDDNLDEDQDGVPDFCDPCPLDNPDDTDGDGVCESDDICAGGDDNLDEDQDGVPDFCDPCPQDNPDDTDGDGVCDSADNCELFNPEQLDCQSNGVGDVCDLDDGTSQDCNENAIPDECDISEGTSDDCNANGTPPCNDACGNGTCEPGCDEDSCTCPADCGSSCGDGCCNGTEDTDTCPTDCGCTSDDECGSCEECKSGACESKCDDDEFCVDGVCKDCLADTDCPGEMLCDDGNECVVCLVDGDCDDGIACTVDRCNNGECDNTQTTCAAGQECDGDTGICVGQEDPGGCGCGQGSSPMMGAIMFFGLLFMRHRISSRRRRSRTPRPCD